jgi:dihydrofolate synthase/folylpolyglutamate synthase
VTASGSSGLDQALHKLYRRNLHAVKLGLEETRALLEELGQPQEAFLSIHVAGTNGKGSVCAMLAAVLQAAGYRTGLYTSPHLIRFSERVRVQGEPITDLELARQIELVEDALARRCESGMRDATFFEFTTALAFSHFRDQMVQVAVIETGMGGRLDATNVITPVLSVITPIGLDHQQHLGHTVEAIAGEKAGIIKPGRPVVCAEMEVAAREVMGRTARLRGAPFVPVAESVQVKRVRQTLAGQRISVETPDEAIGPIILPLLGTHQLANVATAMTALLTFRDTCSLPVPVEAISKGLAAVHWPARLQVVEHEPPVLVDGAHNPPAAMALARALHEVAPKQPVALVSSFLSDKDAVGFLREMAGGVRRLWLVPLANERAMSMADMLTAARGARLDAASAPNLTAALVEAKAWAREQKGLVCVAGSLYLAGEALQRYGIKP